ncbi:hypothetical protein LguiB_008401 [Lonicera macranthoides]
MYGGPGKRGGGGRGGGGSAKRNIHSTFHPTPINRPSTAPGGRLPVGGPRNRTITPAAATATSAPSAADEAFSLVTGNPLNFAMIIRLTPDLVDEIKRAESQGGSARIKFDANANNTSGNVIDVGGKDFRFTWSREMGDLCDIYEERRGGEDGNGLLVESGCAWRKLNVQRVLDESTQNQLKMRSEEAERKLKSRKAIILDHGNPSMKSQVKALAAAESGNTWRTPFKKKEPPPFKKRKAELLPVGGPLKTIHKSGLSSSTHSKGRLSASPLPSPPEQTGAPASPFEAGGLSKGHAVVEDVTSTPAFSKEIITTGFEKEISNRILSGAVQDKQGPKGNLGAQPTDLRTLLISLLMENPKGMSLKALEKAAGETIPNSAKQIEPIIKKASGRYFLKPGVESGSFKKLSSESGSSPEDNQHRIHNSDQIHASELTFLLKSHSQELDRHIELNSKPEEISNAVEKIDIPLHSPGEKMVSNNSEGPAGSSSDSGSDSDSESDSSDSGSDSGSHTRSRSKSKSPVGSGSGSSSDSESDASSNSKMASDEDVDIMSGDDDKEPKHKLLEASQIGLSAQLIPWNGGSVNNVVDEKQDDRISDVVEIEKDLPGNDEEAELVLLTNLDPNKKHAEETQPSSPDHHEHQERLLHSGNLHTESSERKSKGKSKRGSDGKHLDDIPDRTKRLKPGKLTQSQMSGRRNSLPSVSPRKFSPDKPIDGPYGGPTIQTANRAVVDGTEFGLLKDYNQAIPGKLISDSQQSGQRSIDSARPKATAAVERPVGGSLKYSERSLQANEGFRMQKDKDNKEMQAEDGYNANEQKFLKNSRAGGSVGDKHTMPVDSYYRRPSESINGRGSILQRELSDLELGELREPNETPGIKKQFERKSSYKQSENKPTSSDYWNSDLSRVKPVGKTSVVDLVIKPSPPHSGIAISNQRTPEHNVEELTRPHHRAVPTQLQHMLKADHAEVGGSQFNKVADVSSSKSRHDEAGGSQGNGLEGYGDTHKKMSTSAQQQHDGKRGLAPNSAKESKKQKSNNTLGELNGRRKDNTSLTESNDGRQKRREPSSDESSCPYSKYEKEEPELRGAIKDFDQYEEYVQEYHEKYDSYLSLNKILESYRNEFGKLGREYENAKGRDMDRYHNIGKQIKERYRQVGPRHNRLKKIFVVLHEELKQLKETIKDFAASYTKD